VSTFLSEKEPNKKVRTPKSEWTPEQKQASIAGKKGVKMQKEKQMQKEKKMGLLSESAVLPVPRNRAERRAAKRDSSDFSKGDS
jgi:hypothetical protein